MYKDIAFDPWIITNGQFLKLYSYNHRSPIPCPSPFVFQWMKNERFSEKTNKKNMWTTTGLVLLTLTHNIQFGLHIVKHTDYWQHFQEIFCLSLYEHLWIPFVQIFSLAVLWLAMTHCSVCDLPSWMSCPPAEAAATCSSSILTFQHSSAAQHTVAITNATGTMVWQFRHFTPDLLYIIYTLSWRPPQSLLLVLMRKNWE